MQRVVTFAQEHWKYLIGLALVLALLVFVRSEYSDWKQNNQAQKPVTSVNTAGQQSKPGEPQVVYVQGQNTNTKEVVYMQKAVDPATGQQEKTDVQFDKVGNKVYVKVNGKEFEVPAEVQENAKFENGKLVVTEQTEMHINVTAPKPAVNLGLGYGINGPAAQINGPLYKSISWWVYGDKNTAAGGLQFPIMK
jgi:hypothetical protein